MTTTHQNAKHRPRRIGKQTAEVKTKAGFYVRSLVAAVRYEGGVVEDDEEDIGRHVIRQLSGHLYIYMHYTRSASVIYAAALQQLHETN